MPRPPKDPSRPPWAGIGESRETAIARLLEVARAHETHQQTAAALGVAWRTVARWWAWLREHAPEAELPPRAGGTPERAAKARGGRAAKRGSQGMTEKS